MKLDTQKHSTLIIVSILLLAFAATLPAHATSGPREAQGTVLDKDGNPVAGAVITFTPADSANNTPVTAKTNKKGRFFINLFSDRGDDFSIAVEAQGMLPVAAFLESRTVNKVLLGDPIDKQLKYGQSVPNIFIRPLGMGDVKLTLAPEAEVLAAAQAEATAVAVQQADEGGGAAVQPQKDPWDEALALAADGDLADSVSFFETAIEKKPDDLERRETFAKVLYQLDRHDEAIEQATEAVRLAPESIAPRMVIYSAHASRGNLDQAKGVLEEARGIAPQNLNVLEQLAYVAGQQGDSQAAIAAYEQIVEIDPAKADVWAQLGDIYASIGDSAKSEAAYMRVGELDPEGAHTVFFNIGALIMNRTTRSDADTKKAIDAFRKAVQVKPDYAEAHKQLAFALLGAGDRAGAKTALMAYVQHAPAAPDAEQMKNLAAAM